MNTDFCLGGWIIRPQRDCIERGDESVHIKPKAMAVLVCLAEAAGNVVTRNDLFDAVWPGGTVTDDVLTQCIVELRKAFGDSARKQRIIETIPKVGFRLVKPVTPFSNEPTTTTLAGTSANGNEAWNPRNRIFLIISSTILMALVFFWYLTGSRDIQQSVASTENPSIAVLPFVDMSEDQDQGWYADGLTEDLINRLAQLEGLQVTGRTSSFAFKEKNDDLRAIGATLGVNHVLEGSVRREDELLRITAQLVETTDGFHTWSRQYDRPREEIFAVQGEIALAVANSLSVALQVGEPGTVPGGTSSVEAYELLLQARRLHWEYTPDSILKGIELVKQALEIDPGYALGWYNLAGMYLNIINGRMIKKSPSHDWLSLAHEALDRARSLEPDLPNVIAMTASFQNLQWQWSELEETYNHGVDIDTESNSELLMSYAGFLGRLGRVEKAIALRERLKRLEPLSPGNAHTLASAYASQGRIQDGLAEAERAYRLEGFRVKSALIGMEIALSANDRESLLKWLERAEEELDGEPRNLIQAMTERLADRGAALAWLRDTEHKEGLNSLLIATWAAWHGDTELAMETMRRSPAPWTFWLYSMRKVRSAQGFKDLVRQVNLEDYFREFGWNDFCYPVGEDDFECE